MEKVKQAGETERMHLAQEQQDGERAEEEKTRQEDERRQQEEKKKVRLVEEMELDAKEYLWTIYDRGSIELQRDMRGFCYDFGIDGWVEYETVSRRKDSWRLRPWAREFIDGHQDLFRGVELDR